MVSSLYSRPLFYFLGGNRQRSDFLYVSTRTGLPLLHRWAKNLLREGTMKDLYTTNEQILGAAYDRQRNLLAFSVGREAAKLVIIDIAHPKHWQWVPEAGIPHSIPPQSTLKEGSSHTPSTSERTKSSWPDQ